MNEHEVERAVNAWFQDSSGAPEVVDLSDEGLASMRRKLLWISAGKSDEQLYLDEVLALISELLRLRQGISELARDPHAPDCHRVTPDHPGRYLSCACHLHFVRDLIERELVQETRSP